MDVPSGLVVRSAPSSMEEDGDDRVSSFTTLSGAWICFMSSFGVTNRKRPAKKTVRDISHYPESQRYRNVFCGGYSV